VNNCIVKLRGDNELPHLDGSASQWAKLFLSLGRINQGGCREFLSVDRKYGFSSEDSNYFAFPSERLIVHCMIDFPNTAIGYQRHNYCHSLKSFIDEISPARTFLKNKVQSPKELIKQKDIRLKGLDLAFGIPRDVITYDERRYLTPLRFENEPVRHKILDFMGDMYVAGKHVLGEFVIIRPSHKANLQFFRHLQKYLALGIHRGASETAFLAA
jgi:UDP-3-O-acyl-N-acetylglucosamine deacetylase